MMIEIWILAFIFSYLHFIGFQLLLVFVGEFNCSSVRQKKIAKSNLVVIDKVAVVDGNIFSHNTYIHNWPLQPFSQDYGA